MPNRKRIAASLAATFLALTVLALRVDAQPKPVTVKGVVSSVQPNPKDTVVATGTPVGEGAMQAATIKVVSK